ncbi:hypothetical protein IWQ49_000024 [Labrenzia sp. EL_126]|nr:hypothetical protein [Labrenzia sp. EL_126]
MPEDTRSTHNNLPVPDPANDVNEDIPRIGVAIEAIGTLIKLVQDGVAGSAADAHEHTLDDIQGLNDALAALSSAIAALDVPSLAALDDVDVSSATNGMVLLYLGSAWQAANIAAANVTFGSENSVADELTAIGNAITSLSAALGQKADTSSLGSLANKDQVGTGDLIASEVMAALGLGYETRVSGGKAQFKDGSDWKDIDGEALAKANANEALIAALPGQYFADGQGYSSPSLANGVWYENTTGKPILVSVRALGGDLTADLQISSDGSTAHTSFANTVISGSNSWISALVGPGEYYRTTNVNLWREYS